MAQSAEFFGFISAEISSNENSYYCLFEPDYYQEGACCRRLERELGRGTLPEGLYQRVPGVPAGPGQGRARSM